MNTWKQLIILVASLLLAGLLVGCGDIIGEIVPTREATEVPQETPGEVEPTAPPEQPEPTAPPEQPEPTAPPE
ncbi:MAG: hypothetical protein MI924_28550, partial [Chloroflexales bacterium]|nr:hypothetical protein [Chloroflexales bacterium]